MPLPHLRIDRPLEGVAVLTLDRPAALNALDSTLVASLTRAVADLAEDADEGGLRALIVTGAGSAFCAGLDRAELRQHVFVDHTTLDDLRYFPVPVIAAINGPAVAGGLELALAADIRIGSEHASFADTHAQIGIMPAWGLTARLPQAIGQAWARRMSFTGEEIDAATALRIGLLTEVTPSDHLLPRALDVATGITRSDPATVASLRALYDTARDETGSEALAGEVLRAGSIVDLTRFDHGRP